MVMRATRPCHDYCEEIVPIFFAPSQTLKIRGEKLRGWGCKRSHAMNVMFFWWPPDTEELSELSDHFMHRRACSYVQHAIVLDAWLRAV